MTIVQVYGMPAFDLLEKILVDKFQFTDWLDDMLGKFRFQPVTQKETMKIMRIATRITYVCEYLCQQ